MKYIMIFLFFLCATFLHAQDINVLLKEASNYEKQLNETEAYKRYAQVAELDAKNITALVKCIEINCAIGTRQKDENQKTIYFNSAQTFAQKAYLADSTNSDVNYAMALASFKLAEVADENKEIFAYARQSKVYIDKALAINPNNSRANYIMGKWQFNMLNVSWTKRAASKTIKGGLPKGDIDSAIYYMEKCRALDMYFVRNYLDLAKAYQFKNRAEKELDVLTKMVKLPNRTPDDAALKAEGQQMLDAFR